MDAQPTTEPTRAEDAVPPISTLEHVATHLIDADPNNLRRTPPDEQANSLFLESVRTQGVLVPLLLRPMGERLRIVHGHRRHAAAVLAGHESVPCYIRPMSDAEAAAAQAAENFARAGVQTLDQWRAINNLTERHGFDLATAARMIGLEGRMVERMHRLSLMHPDVLAAMERHGIPSNHHLALIAGAPPELQAEAILRVSKGANQPIAWDQVSTLCRMERIPRTRAIFEAESSPIAWSQDLFAPKGTDEEWTTSDTATFLRLQTEALQQRVAAAAEAEQPESYVEWNPSSGGPVIPEGYQRAWREDDGKPLSKRGKFRRLWWVVREGWHIGAVQHCLVEKMPSQEALDEQGEGADAPPRRQREQPPLTKAGQAIVADAKTVAVRTHLAEMTYRWTHAEAAAALIFAFAARNVTVRGDPDNPNLITPMGDLAARLIDTDGRILPERAREVAAEVVARVMLDARPDSPMHGSGEALARVARLIDADQALPRFDTAEVLATVNGAEIRRLAAEAGIVGIEKVAALRTALVGRLPDWRPGAFTAPELADGADGRGSSADDPPPASPEQEQAEGERLAPGRRQATEAVVGEVAKRVGSRIRAPKRQAPPPASGTKTARGPRRKEG